MTPTPQLSARQRFDALVTAWLDLWVHGALPSGSGLLLHKVRTQVLVAWLGIVVFTAAGMAEVFSYGTSMSHQLMLLMYVHGVLGCVAVLVSQRLMANHVLSGNLLSLVSFSFGLAMTVVGGGMEAPALYWLPMTPLLAFVSVGSGSALLWLWLLMMTITGVYWVDVYGSGFPDLLPEPVMATRSLAHVLVMSVVVFAISFAWERGQQAFIEDLQDARDVARAADQGKSNLVAIVSHELRTPMNGVLGMLDLLRDTELDDLQMRYADTARGAARSLLDILDDLLDRSRIDAGRLGLDEVSFRVMDVLESVENLVDLGGFGRSVPVHFDIGDGVDWTLHGDPRRLRQIINNLVGNALKFTDEGEVVVRAHGEPVGDKMRVYLEVHDTGIGIPPERLPAVFDAFTQVDGSITRRYGGTGLGLSITRDMVEMMGGTIQAQSQPGEGTSFYVEIPFGVATAAVVDEPTEPAAPRLWYGGVRVLVAEDNAVNQMVVRGFLQRHGVQPELVEDGEQAVFAAMAAPFDLILMDCEMPVMDGFAATEALRKQGYEGPIVALTAHASSTVRARCLASGMDGFLTKPIGTGALIKVLYRFVGARLKPVASMRPGA